MKLDKAINAVKACLVLCIVLCVISIFTTTLDPQLSFLATLVSGLSFVISFVIALIFCKCPYCGKRILLGMFKLKRCPKCHRDLATGERNSKGNKKKH